MYITFSRKVIYDLLRMPLGEIMLSNYCLCVTLVGILNERGWLKIRCLLQRQHLTETSSCERWFLPSSKLSRKCEALPIESCLILLSSQPKTRVDNSQKTFPVIKGRQGVLGMRCCSLKAHTYPCMHQWLSGLSQWDPLLQTAS